MKAGDKVKVITIDQTYEGILMPSVDMSGKDTIILKLVNGYNMGIDKKNVINTKVLEKYKLIKHKETKIVFNKKLPTVSILSTGGTISSKVDYRTGGVYADYTAKDFVEMMPELKDIANINAKKVLSLMSEDMLPSDWTNIAKVIEKEIKSGVDGIVITQGTDTLHFTAAALSFMVDCNIPIVITGSQRSIDRGSSDAFMNLLCSVKAAAHSDIAEVMTCLHGSSNDDYCLLIRGTKVRKMHTSRRDAFRPINDVALAKVRPDKIEITNKNYKKADREKKLNISINTKFEENIALFYVYPGLDPDILEFYIKKKVKGIIIGATALGHVNTWTKKSLIPGIKKCFKNNIPVFITSQTLYGSVNPFVYSNLRTVSIESHGVYLKDMLPETAYIKLGWALGQEKNIDKVKEIMLKNCRNEFNDILSSEMFLN